MIKKAVVLCLILFLILLSGCSPHSTVSAVALTGTENAIVSCLSDAAFVFEYQASAKNTYLTVWLEEYKNGQKENAPLEKIICGTEKQNKGIILFTLFKSSQDGASQSFNLSVNNGVVKSTRIQPFPQLDGMAWEVTKEKSIPIQGKITLAAIMQTGGNAYSPLPQVFYKDTENNLDALKQYDKAYLLRCEFTDKEPKA